MESKYFLKKINSKTKSLIGIILILLSIILEILMVNNYNDEKKSAKPYEEAKSSGEYVYVDVTGFTDYFATYTNDDSKQYYHFLFDGKYLYIGKIKPNNYNKLPGRIYGYTTAIPSELVSIAIDEYNSYSDEDVVSSENFYETFGTYYIDNYRSPQDDLIGFTILLSISFIIGIVLIIIDVSRRLKIKKELEVCDIEKVLKEIDSKETISNHKAQVYLTNKSLISYKSKLDIIKYEDIVWIYPHTEKYRGVTNVSTMIMDTHGKIHTVGSMNLNKNTNNEYNEMYANLEYKVPNALSGYTAENKDKAKEIIENNKSRF